MKSLNDISLENIAPSSILGDENINAIINALNPELNIITDFIAEEFIYSRINELDSGVLDLLAWQFHVDFYDLAKDLPAKRKQVINSIQWHMKKGTAWAILKALDMIGVDAEFINWYEFGGEPYTFKIKANLRHDYFNYSNKDEITQNIIRAINEAKATRSFLAHLETTLNETDKTNLFAGIAQGTGGLVTVKLAKPDQGENTQNLAALAQGLSGYEILNLSRSSNDENKIYMAMAENKSRSISLGLELDTMNELLAQFEARIFDALAQHEARIMAAFDERQNEINLKIDEILELLRWEDSTYSLK